MSQSHRAMLPAQALGLAAALEEYRDTVRAFLQEPRDTALQQQLRARLRAMGEIAAMLPAIWVPWGALVVLHFELVNPRWRSAGADTKKLFAIVSDHQSALEVLHRRCLEWAGAQQAPQAPPPPKGPSSAT